VGTRDSALDSMAWPACAGRLRTGTSLTLPRSKSGRRGQFIPDGLHRYQPTTRRPAHEDPAHAASAQPAHQAIRPDPWRILRLAVPAPRPPHTGHDIRREQWHDQFPSHVQPDIVAMDGET
jgi:hypothetical protein